MLSALLTVIIRLLFSLLSMIFKFVISFFPDFDYSGVTSAFSLFFGFCEQGLNFLYFISGGLIFVFIDFWFALWAIKHVVLPIINFTRKAISDLF